MLSQAINRFYRCPLAVCFLLFLVFLVFYMNKMPAPTLIQNPMDWNTIRKRTTMEGLLESITPGNDERNRTFEIRFKNIHMEYRYDFVDPCSKSTNFLILSMSSRGSFEKRNTVRQTWMADALNKEKIRFLIADSNEKSEKTDILKRLQEEQARYGDLIFIHGFADKYKHIHLKWYAGLQWQQVYCPNVEWVAKADDDTIVDLRRLDFWMDHKFQQLMTEHPLVFMGSFKSHDKPIRNKTIKWYVSEDLYPGAEWPDYQLGAVYLTNPATIAAVLEQAQNCAGFFLDDVLFTGILAEKANVTRLDMNKHFVWSGNLNDKNPKCELGVPTAVSMLGSKDAKDFERNYKRIKSMKCRRGKNENQRKSKSN